MAFPVPSSSGSQVSSRVICQHAKDRSVFNSQKGSPPPLGQKPSYVYGCVPPLRWAGRKAHEIAGQLKEVGFLLAKGRPYPGGREPGPPNLTPDREQHPRCQMAILKVILRAVRPCIFTFAFKEAMQLSRSGHLLGTGFWENTMESP